MYLRSCLYVFNYFHIKYVVLGLILLHFFFQAEDGIRYLHFDSEWVQGAMRLKKPSELVLAYTRQMMAWLLFLEPDARSQIGILGLGAGSLLRFVLGNTPASAVTVEWNPDEIGRASGMESGCR